MLVYVDSNGKLQLFRNSKYTFIYAFCFYSINSFIRNLVRYTPATDGRYLLRPRMEPPGDPPGDSGVPWVPGVCLGGRSAPHKTLRGQSGGAKAPPAQRSGGKSPPSKDNTRP